MSRDRPDNGPTFSKATIKMSRPLPPSPVRQDREREDAAREAATYRRMHELLRTDPAAALDEWEKTKQ
jgi:hypothetical protein